MADDAPDHVRAGLGFRQIFALILVTLLTALFARLIAPFVEALLLAIVLSGLVYPVYAWLKRHHLRPGLAAGLTTLLVLVAIIVPMLFVVGASAHQAIELSQSLVPWLEQQVASARIAFLWPEWLPLAEDINVDEAMSQLSSLLNQSGTLFVGGLGSATQATFLFFLQLFIMLYTMFYLFVAGDRLIGVFDYTPLTQADRDRIAERGISITRATLKGTVVIGVIQGALAGAAFAVVGIQGPIFWGVIMAILSAIPGIGAALVWLPAVVVLLVRGDIAAGVGLGVWCTIVVSTVDNFLRPYLVGSEAQMPAVLILLSTLGGIAMFGATGIIIGPLLAGLFLTSWHIFAAAFRQELLDSGAPSPSHDSGPILAESSGPRNTAETTEPTPDPGPKPVSEESYDDTINRR